MHCMYTGFCSAACDWSFIDPTLVLNKTDAVLTNVNINAQRITAKTNFRFRDVACVFQNIKTVRYKPKQQRTRLNRKQVIIAHDFFTRAPSQTEKKFLRRDLTSKILVHSFQIIMFLIFSDRIKMFVSGLNQGQSYAAQKTSHDGIKLLKLKTNWRSKQEIAYIVSYITETELIEP